MVQAVKKCIFAAKQYVMFDTAIKDKLPITQTEAEQIGALIMIAVHGCQSSKPFDKEKKLFRFVMNRPLDNDRYIHLLGEYTMEGNNNHMELTDMEVCDMDQYITHKLNESTVNMYPPDVIFIA